MVGAVIFHSPGELQASAAVHGWWQRPPAELVIESQACGGFGNDVQDSCAAFVGWLFSQSPVPGSFSVLSLPGLPWAGEDHDPWEWYDRVMAEVAKWDPPPVLVDLDDFLVSHRGEVLWPPPEHRRGRRTDRRSRPPGAPFPIGWYGQGLGEFRPGRSTYECYPPEELPSIRVPLTGTFDWLQAAPEHSRSVAPNPEWTATALNRLLAATPAGLPREFVAFFRSPSLWRRIRSCTDCYLRLDSAAVGIRDGSGALIRFLSDAQDCKHWHLWLSPSGTRHSVVATYRFTGSEHAHLKDGLPHPRDITTCAGSFEEFVYRFWLENELWFALRDKGRMPEGGEEYLAFYRSRGQGAEPPYAPSDLNHS
jgi:hypothetical protein